MADTLVLEASDASRESSSLSIRTNLWAVSDNGSTSPLHGEGKSSILLRSTICYTVLENLSESE